MHRNVWIALLVIPCYNEEVPGGAMTIQAILEKEIGERNVNRLPAEVKHQIKTVDSLPPSPRPITSKQLADLLR